MWHDADGDVLTVGFMFGPHLSVTPRASLYGNSMCLASGLQHYACIKGPPPEHPPWEGAQIFSIDPKQRQLAGLVDGHLRVWSATGEVRYAQ